MQRSAPPFSGITELRSPCPAPVPLPVGKSRLLTPQQRHRPPRAAVFGHCSAMTSAHSSLRSSFIPPPSRSRSDSPLNCRGAERRRPIRAGRSVPMASPPSDSRRRSPHWRTQNAALSFGVSVGWHWEHLWLKGKRTGWGRERGRGPGTDKHFIVPVRSRWGRPNMQHTSW